MWKLDVAETSIFLSSNLISFDCRDAYMIFLFNVVLSYFDGWTYHIQLSQLSTLASWNWSQWAWTRWRCAVQSFVENKLRFFSAHILVRSMLSCPNCTSLIPVCSLVHVELRDIPNTLLWHKFSSIWLIKKKYRSDSFSCALFCFND